MDTILYHGKCPDGWTAAYIASCKYPEAQLVPLDHGTDFEPVIDDLKDKHVLMLDFSFKTREQNIRAADIAASFLCLDHHKTAQDKIGDLPRTNTVRFVFDMNSSGAGLAWDYLFGTESVYKLDRPWWVNYTEARDLWRWDSLPNAKEICAYLSTVPFTKEAYKSLNTVYSIDAYGLGKGALAHIEHYVREAIQQTKYGELDGHKVGVTNVIYLNCSEVGMAVAKMADYSLTWFERHDGNIQFSLRSVGNFDVSEIAKKYGGGGHKNAAGFELKIPEGRRLIDVILGR
jgi:oligoribonuclease NrnB/cAMP/cGMP phosphodiesterase (DHH superfamily)